MPASRRSTARTLWTAVRITVLLTVLLGLVYPLLLTGVGQLAFPAQANGSLVRNGDGDVVGSALLAQPFTDAEGAPLAEWFQPRPSAAGDGYDGAASGGSNLGPENEELIAMIQERRAQVAAFNGVDPAQVPPDAVTASGSGLDPHISPAYAALQVERVAGARGLSADEVQALVAEHTLGRTLGFLGEPVVNVLELNLALEARSAN